MAPGAGSRGAAARRAASPASSSRVPGWWRPSQGSTRRVSPWWRSSGSAAPGACSRAGGPARAGLPAALRPRRERARLVLRPARRRVRGAALRRLARRAGGRRAARRTAAACCTPSPACSPGQTPAARALRSSPRPCAKRRRRRLRGSLRALAPSAASGLAAAVLDPSRQRLGVPPRAPPRASPIGSRSLSRDTALCKRSAQRAEASEAVGAGYAGAVHEARPSHSGTTARGSWVRRR